MSNGRQRQRHGVTKHLAEGIGGLLVGAAAVLLLRQWLNRRSEIRAPVSVTAADGAGTATVATDPPAGALGRPRQPQESHRESTP